MMLVHLPSAFPLPVQAQFMQSLKKATITTHGRKWPPQCTTSLWENCGSIRWERKSCKIALFKNKKAVNKQPSPKLMSSNLVFVVGAFPRKSITIGRWEMTSTISARLQIISTTNCQNLNLSFNYYFLPVKRRGFLRASTCSKSFETWQRVRKWWKLPYSGVFKKGRGKMAQQRHLERSPYRKVSWSIMKIATGSAPFCI